MIAAVSARLPLKGLRVLIVEDESIVAMLLEDMLSELGCQTVGPAGRNDEALELISAASVDAAILDINIAGEMVFPVADRLQDSRIPFVFATGYGATGVAERHSARQVLQKPYSLDELRRAIEHALQG